MNDLLEFIAAKNNSDAEKVSGGLYCLKDNIFVPNYYVNSPFFLKENAVIWIKKDANSFDVYKLIRNCNLEELLTFIQGL